MRPNFVVPLLVLNLVFVPALSFLIPLYRPPTLKFPPKANLQQAQKVRSTSPSTIITLCSSPTDDDDITPLIVPEIVLEENPATAAARETQQSAYRWGGEREEGGGGEEHCKNGLTRNVVPATRFACHRTSGLVYGAATMDLWSKTGKLTSFSQAVLTSTTGAANVVAAVASYTLWGATKEVRTADKKRHICE